VVCGFQAYPVYWVIGPGRFLGITVVFIKTATKKTNIMPAAYSNYNQKIIGDVSSCQKHGQLM